VQLLRTLTSRESAVLAALVTGGTARQIPLRHQRSVSTVRTQIAAVLGRLGLHSQVEAMACVLRRDIAHIVIVPCLSLHFMMTSAPRDGSVHGIASSTQSSNAYERG